MKIQCNLNSSVMRRSRCLLGANGSKIRVSHGLLRGQSFLMIVAANVSTVNSSKCSPKQVAHKVEGLVGDQVLVFSVDESGPGLLGVRGEDGVKVRIQLQVVLVQIVEQLVRAQHLEISAHAHIKRNSTLAMRTSWS